MSYLVLARKYRPQRFADLTGQEHVVQTLTNALRTGRVAHALLLCGPRGCGKTTSARIIAKALNCVQGPTPEPCGVCTPCREITAGTDVDVQEIDAASNTGVDNVRELRESAKYLPARDRYKIFIVDEVHMLSKAAFNAFLKTLEEPPGHVKFVFATTDPQALPDTILSRCQRHNFRLVPLKQITARTREIATAENVQIDDASLALVARQAAGSMRDALSILDQLFSSVPSPIREADAAAALGALDRRVIADLASALLQRSPGGVLEGIARAYDGGHDLKRLAEDLATHLRNLVAAGVAGATLDLPDFEVKALREQASMADPAELARLFDLTHAALTDVSRAGHPRQALEVALLRAVYVAPSTSVQSLLGRAEELAKRLGAGGGGGGGPGGGGSGGGTRSVPPPARDAGPRARPDFSASAAAASAPVPVAPPAPAPAPAPVAVAPAMPAAVEAAPVPAPRPPDAPRPTFQPVELTPPVIVRPPEPRPAAKDPSKANGGGSPWERHLGASGVDAPPMPARVEVVFPASAAPPVSPAPLVVAAPAPVAAPVVTAPAAAAPSPVPVSAAPHSNGTPAALSARWPEFVEAVRAKKRLLGTLLEHARPLSLEGGELVIGFPRGNIYVQSITPEKGAIEQLLGEAAGQTIRLQVVELKPEDEGRYASLAETNERAEREAREARLKGGREHPAIARVVALLGAEIEDVRDLGGMA